MAGQIGQDCWVSVQVCVVILGVYKAPCTGSNLPFAVQLFGPHALLLLPPPSLSVSYIYHVWAWKPLQPRHHILSLWCLGGNSHFKGRIIYKHHHHVAFQAYTYARPESSSWQLVQLPSFGRFWNSIQLVPESQIFSVPLIIVQIINSFGS